jgi:predicted nucleic acid-binding protein
VAGRTAVTNTSPLIALCAIGRLALLDELFDEVLVPLEVWGELSDKADAPEPDILARLRCTSFRPSPAPPPETSRLHAGERAAIALAAVTPGCVVLLDERAARRVALARKLEVRGSLAILIEAKRRGLVAELRPLLDALIARGYRLSQGLVEQALEAARER